MLLTRKRRTGPRRPSLVLDASAPVASISNIQFLFYSLFPPPRKSGTSSSFQSTTTLTERLHTRSHESSILGREPDRANSESAIFGILDPGVNFRIVCHMFYRSSVRSFLLLFRQSHSLFREGSCVPQAKRRCNVCRSIFLL